MKLRRVVLSLVLLTSAFGAAHAALFEDEDARRAILDLRKQVEVLKTELEQKNAEQGQRNAADSQRLNRAPHRGPA